MLSAINQTSFIFESSISQHFYLRTKNYKLMSINWAEAMKPLIKKYKGKQHPLEYKNIYQLLVMVILSARDSDRHINSLAPALFDAYPDMSSLARASDNDLLKYVGKVVNSANKAKWLVTLAQKIKKDSNIPTTMETLTELPGIGRKSANVIMREAGAKPEGVMVDLHVLRVAPRLGIATGTNPEKIEKQIMEVLPQKDWGEAGMSISFLGRETCRPSNPKHSECVMNSVCEYYWELHSPGTKKANTEKPAVKKENVPAKKTAAKKTGRKKR
jgi:endonuclease III